MAVETIEQARREPPKGKITFEQFLDWCDEDTWAEWADGEVLVLPPATPWDRYIAGLIGTVLGIYAEEHNLGKVIFTLFVMRLPEIPSAREPDLLFISRERLHLIKDTYLDGPADVVIEIVSPESIGRDRGDKFVEYERAGVSEYWLIDPLRESAEFYELSADGRYRLAPIEEGIYRSKVISGFWLRVEWLWQTPPPPALDVLRELKVI